MAKHENHSIEKLCPSCAEKLLDADIRLRNWFLETVNPKFPNAHISWSYRDAENQNKAFAQSRTNFVYPLSPHNKTNNIGKPYARALDLFKLTEDGKADFPFDFYKSISELITKDMKWGGNFKHLGDSDHFQLDE